MRHIFIAAIILASHKNKYHGKCDVTSTSSLYAQTTLALSRGDGINRHRTIDKTNCVDKSKIQEEKTMEGEYSEVVNIPDNILDSVDEESRGNVLNVVKANNFLQVAKLTFDEQTWENLHDVLLKFWLRNMLINTRRKNVVRETNHTSRKDCFARQAWDTILKLTGGHLDLMSMLEELVESQQVDAITTI